MYSIAFRSRPSLARAIDAPVVFLVGPIFSRNGHVVVGKVMQDAITSLGPDSFDAAYVQNDEMMAGALQAMEEAGLNPGKYWLGSSNERKVVGLGAKEDHDDGCQRECDA